MTTPQQNPMYALDAGLAAPATAAPATGQGRDPLSPPESFDVWIGSEPNQAWQAYSSGPYLAAQNDMIAPKAGLAGYIPSYQNSVQLIATLDSFGPGSDQMRTLQDQLFQAGYGAKRDITGNINDNTRQGFLQLLQDQTGYNNAHPGAELTYQQYLDQAATARKKLEASGLLGNTSTSTVSHVDLSDPITAGVLINRMMQQFTGRGASNLERQHFLTALHAYQSAHPSVSTSTTTVDAAGNSRSRSTESSSQVSPEAYAQAYAQSGALGVEANTYKVASDYYQAALSIIKAGGH